MHIPDGFLTTPVWLTLDAACVPAIGALARRAQRDTGESRAPMLGVLGAFVFAAQMINFPVGAGVSGHLVGGALLAATLGPAAAAIVMTAILAVQALVFQDGGILVLGANVFNMAFAGVLAGHLPIRTFGLRPAAVFASGFLSMMVAASLALAELMASGVRIPGAILAASLGVFTVTAAIEGAITLAVVQSLERLHPSWIRQTAGGSRAAGALMIAAVLLATAGALAASSLPDGLEHLAESLGIAGHARNLFTTPLADYETQFFGASWLRKATAGLAGLAVIYFLGLAAARFLTRRRSA